MSAGGDTLVRKMFGRRSWRFWFGGILSILSLIWLILTTDWPETWLALTSADYRWVLLALFINLITIPVRTVRWGSLFQRPRRPPFGRLTAIMLIGQAVNVFMPARAGDIVRSALVETENAAYVLGTQMMTLAADLLMTSVLVLLLLTRIETPQWMRRPGELLLAVGALTLFGMIVLAYGSKYLQRALQWLEGKWSWPRGLGVLAMIREFLRSFILLKSPWLLITLSVITVVLWTLYTFVNWVLLEAAGVSLQWPESAAAALFVLVVLQLGVAVPTSPGRVGVYHFLAVQALAVFSVDQPMAVSFSILLHLISVIIPAGIGVLLAWRMGLTVGKPKWEGG